MRNSKLSKVLALTLVFALIISNFVYAEPAGNVISNELGATFNVTEDVSVGMEITYTSPEFIVGVPTEYTVTTVSNGDKGKIVRAYFTLPTEASVEYFENNDSKWYPLGNEYGPSTGFPVSDATSRFRATYTAPGTYTTTVTFKELGGTVVAAKDIVATVVEAPIPAEVTINLPVDGFIVGEKGEFTIATTANSDKDTMVIGNSIFANQEAIASLEYYETSNSTWYPLSGDFGPSEGFPLADASSKFRISFNAAGSYEFTVNIREAANHDNIVATKSASFVVKAAPVNPISEVNSIGGLIAALNDTTKTTININADFETTEKILVNRSLIINGKGHKITFTGDDAGWQGNYVLQVYGTTGVTINNLKMTGADGGLLVNSSAVTLTGTIDVSGNEFGGIEVSKGTATGLSNSSLTVIGTLINSSEAFAKPTIWLVKGQGTVTGGNVPASAIEMRKMNNEEQIQYYMVAANTADFVKLTWDIEDAAIGAKVGQNETAVVTAKLAAVVKEVKNARLVIEVSKASIEVGDFGFTTITGGTTTGTPEQNASWLNATVSDAGDKLTFLWGPDEGTTISSEVITTAGFKFNNTGSYTVKMYLIQVK